jgi:hypothetical protein
MLTEADITRVLERGDLETQPGASLEMIRAREAELGVRFPDDYVHLMTFSNGLEGFIELDRDGGFYIRIDPIDEMMSETAQQLAAEFWPHLIVFGGDGGGEAFAFDTRDEMKVVMFPWTGGADDAIPQTPTLLEFLQRGLVFGSSAS